MPMTIAPCHHATNPPHWHLLHRLANGDTLALPGAGFTTEADGAWWQETLAICADWDWPPEDWWLPDRLLVGRVLARMAAWQAGVPW